MNKYKALYMSQVLINQGLIEDKNGSINPNVLSTFSEKTYQNLLLNKDLILCANRYIWKNLPSNFTSQQLESLFYQYGVLCFYLNEKGVLTYGQFAPQGELNEKGFLNQIKPIDFAGKTKNKLLNVVTVDGEEPKKDVAILIYDYTYFTQAMTNQSRLIINQSTTINDEIQVYRQLYLAVQLSVKKMLVMCENDEQKNAIIKQASALLNPNIPIIPINYKNKMGQMDLKNNVNMFNFDKNFEVQNYCQLIDFYNKIRRQFNGIPSPDTFEKKERKISAETEDVSAHTDIVLDDGLQQRINGLNLIKKFFPEYKNITVELNPILCEKEVEEEPEKGVKNE